MEETVLSVAQELLSKLGLDASGFSVRKEDDQRQIFYLTMQSQDSRLLIGPRGQTLATLEYVLGLIVERKLASRAVVHVEVNDYRASQDAKLFSYVDEKVKDVLRAGGKIALRPMTSYERKKVHSYVGDKQVEGLRTVSQDDPTGRTLYVTFEGKVALAIDMDSAGI